MSVWRGPSRGAHDAPHRSAGSGALDALWHHRAMKRRIAVVGSGIVGLVAAHGLLAQGHEVTLYSDRSAEDWLHRSSPTGGAGRFHDALELERSLGLAHWDDHTPGSTGST